MKKYLKFKIIAIFFIIPIVGIVGCKKDFLKPEPLSFYTPETAYSDVAGLQAALVACARNLRFEYYGGNPPILTEMLFTEIAVEGTTDKSGPAQDLNLLITPDGVTFNNDDRNKIGVYWDEGYKGIKYANTVISRIDDSRIKYTTPAQRNAILGAAYFHRALRYYRLTNQFGDVPAVMKEITEPVLNFYSVKREVILQKIKLDLDSALLWTSDDVSKVYKGDVTKGAVAHLLTKVNLALGNFDEAITAANTIINGSTYSLMKTTFGSAPPPFTVPAGKKLPVALPSNVIWDLHRPENKSSSQNREGIFMIIDRFGEGQFGTGMTIMRQAVPFWGSNIKTPSGKVGTNDNTNPEFVQSNLYGRGIGRTRPSNYAQYEIWNDSNDLRHAKGNWKFMEDLLYNDMGLKPNDTFYLKNLQLRNATGGLLTIDTIRSYFGWPHYKIFVDDNENSPKQGGHSDWYLFRIAETYLLRAEANFWKGNLAAAAADINIVRARANCKPITMAQVDMSAIIDERARELFFEEPRKTEMTRISYLFAKTGKPAENGKVYSLASFSENNYLYDRVIAKNNFYKLGLRTLHLDQYTISPYHTLWPIPSTSIQGNSGGIINQNKGYIGFEKNVPALDKIPD